MRNTVRILFSTNFGTTTLFFLLLLNATTAFTSHSRQLAFHQLYYERPIKVIQADVTCTPFPVRKYRKSINRKPKYYWTQEENFIYEINQFWKDAGVKVDSNITALVPNETLLNFFRRHDMRAAISSRGGRQVLEEEFTSLEIQSGKWKEAVKHPYMQQLINGNPKLSADRPPRPTKAKKQTSTTRPWSHTKYRNEMHYWSVYKVVESLYEYTTEYSNAYDRPAVWMPRLHELTKSNQIDLTLAIQRCGGADKITKLSGMVPYSEWHYFEGLLRLMVLLRDYLNEFPNDTVCNISSEGKLIQSEFPNVSEIKRRGHEELFNLIRYYGGRKMVALRLGFRHQKESVQNKKRADDDILDLNWGIFDFHVGISLLCFIRESHLKRFPPMRQPSLSIPSSKMLIRAGREDLHKQIEIYGGYENVARRLGLAYSI